MEALEIIEQRIRELTEIRDQVEEQMLERQRAHQQVSGALGELQMMANRLRSEESEGAE